MQKSVSYSSYSAYDMLSDITDKEEIYSLYKKNNVNYINCLEKLISLDIFDIFFLILENELNSLILNIKEYERVLNIVNDNLVKIRESGHLPQLMKMFLSLLKQRHLYFQKYIICRVISILVGFNGKFPDKNFAITYLNNLLVIFKESNSFNNYLIALYYLDKLHSVELSEDELDYLKKCATIKSEPFCKELFCGMRSINLETIFKDKIFTTKKFYKDMNWELLIELKYNNSSTDLNVNFISFLKKNSIDFVVIDGKVYIGDYSSKGITKNVLDIAKKYEVKKEKTKTQDKIQDKENIELNIIKDLKENTENVKKTDIRKPECPKKPTNKVKFSDRFSKPLREFKWYYMNAKYKFEDDHLEERQKIKEEKFFKFKKKFDIKKKIFNEKKNLILNLSAKLKNIIDEKIKKEKEDAINRMELEFKENAKTIDDSLLYRKNNIARNNNSRSSVSSVGVSIENARSIRNANLNNISASILNMSIENPRNIRKANVKNSLSASTASGSIDTYITRGNINNYATPSGYFQTDRSKRNINRSSASSVSTSIENARAMRKANIDNILTSTATGSVDNSAIRRNINNSTTSTATGSVGNSAIRRNINNSTTSTATGSVGNSAIRRNINNSTTSTATGSVDNSAIRRNINNSTTSTATRSNQNNKWERNVRRNNNN